MLYLIGSFLDINSITFFVLQSPIVADVREPGFNVGSLDTTLIRLSEIRLETRIKLYLSCDR